MSEADFNGRWGPWVEASSNPYNHEAEAALLGGLLANNGAWEKVGTWLRPEHFADAEHGRIFAAIGQTIEAGHIADPVTLHDSAKDPGYLAELAGSLVTTSGVADYGLLIHDLWIRREIVAVADDMLANARTFGIDMLGAGQIEAAQGRLQEISDGATGGPRGRGLVSILEWTDQAIAAAERAVHARAEGRLIGLTTGLKSLDDFIDGLERGRLTIVAGRPGMGKSVLGFNMAVAAAEAGARVAVHSLEMSGEELAFRVLSAMTGLSHKQMARGHMPPGGFELVIEARAKLAALRDRLHIDDAGGQSISGIIASARRHKRSGGLDLVVVDHGGLASPSEWALRRSGGNRTQDVSEITSALKVHLAKGLQVPVVCLWQLSRKVEERDNKRPTLGDLRDSGTIEQDADQVIFIYRESYYAERDKPARKAGEADAAFDGRMHHWSERLAASGDTAELIVAKQRVGPVGAVKVGFDGAQSRFYDLGAQ